MTYRAAKALENEFRTKRTKGGRDGGRGTIIKRTLLLGFRKACITFHGFGKISKKIERPIESVPAPM